MPCTVWFMGNFGQKTNSKVHFTLVSWEYLGPLEVACISLTGWTEICHSILTNQFIALLFFSRFCLCAEFGKGIKNGKIRSSRLAWLDQEMLCQFSCCKSHCFLTSQSGIMESTLVNIPGPITWEFSPNDQYTTFVQQCKLMYQSNPLLPHPPPFRAYSGHLMSFPAREGGNLINLFFPAVGHLITTLRGWGIWSLALI